MLRKTAKWLGALGLTLAALSCTSVQPEQGDPGTVTTEALPGVDVVPLEWGDLAAVTRDQTTSISYLWFQNDSGAVRMVSFDHQRNRLWERAALIRRR